jgi:hypothetical protein
LKLPREVQAALLNAALSINLEHRHMSMKLVDGLLMLLMRVVSLLPLDWTSIGFPAVPAARHNSCALKCSSAMQQQTLSMHLSGSCVRMFLCVLAEKVKCISDMLL